MGNKGSKQPDCCPDYEAYDDTPISEKSCKLKEIIIHNDYEKGNVGEYFPLYHRSNRITSHNLNLSHTQMGHRKDMNCQLTS